MTDPNCIHTISWLSGQTQETLRWRQWFKIGIRKSRQDLTGLFEVIGSWQDRAQQRRQLMALSDKMLKDIGITRAEAWRENRKPFWKE